MSKTKAPELDPPLRGFLDWAREQGWSYAMAPSVLGCFQRFLHDQGIHSLEQVDSALLLAYQRRLLLSRRPATVNGHRVLLGALWRYLLRQGLADVDATQAMQQLRPDAFIPYLYSPAALGRIDMAMRAAAERAPTEASRFSRQTHHAAFRLMRDCGLRVSEACKLDVEDYDRALRTLRIANTKFLKTRVIPLPRSTCDVLDAYLPQRLRRAAGQAAPRALLLSVLGSRLSRITLESSFRQLLRALRAYQPRRRRGRTVLGSSNLHALRHSFAVRTLERWQVLGLDVEQLLPLLSGYMGHDKVTYTAVYLHLTPTLRQIASERLAGLALPGLDHRRRRREP